MKVFRLKPLGLNGINTFVSEPGNTLIMGLAI